MASRSAITRRIATEDAVRLLEWFAESYDEGWRPELQSHVAGVSARYTPFGVDALREKCGQLLAELATIDK